MKKQNTWVTISVHCVIKKKKGLVCCTLFDVHVPVIYPTHTNIREATMRTCVMEKSITMATLLACTAPP